MPRRPRARPPARATADDAVPSFLPRQLPSKGPIRDLPDEDEGTDVRIPGERPVPVEAPIVH